MMTALESLWHDSCLLNPSLLGQAIADVAQAHFGVYIIYCSNAIYQNRKLNELMFVHSAYLLTGFALQPLGYTQPLTSTWPNLRCDVGLKEGEY